MLLIQEINISISNAVGTIPSTSGGDNLFNQLFSALNPDMGTLLGAIIGAAAAISASFLTSYLSNMSQNNRENALAYTFLKAIKYELEGNKKVLERLKNPIKNKEEDTTPNSGSREELWDWSISISRSLSFKAYENLTRSGFQRFINKVLWSDIISVYQDITEIEQLTIIYKDELKFKFGETTGALNRDQLNRYALRTKIDEIIRLIERVNEKID